MAVTGVRAGVYRCTAVGDSVSGSLLIEYFRWIKGSAAGHGCTVNETDASGPVLFESEADGAHFTDLHQDGRWREGFYVSQLDSGVLFVYTI